MTFLRTMTPSAVPTVNTEKYANYDASKHYAFVLHRFSFNSIYLFHFYSYRKIFNWHHIYRECDITTMHAFISIPSNFCSRCIRHSSRGNYAFFIDPNDSANRISSSLTSDMCDSAFVYLIDAHVFFVSFHRCILFNLCPRIIL